MTVVRCHPLYGEVRLSSGEVLLRFQIRDNREIFDLASEPLSYGGNCSGDYVHEGVGIKYRLTRTLPSPIYMLLVHDKHTQLVMTLTDDQMSSFPSLNRSSGPYIRHRALESLS